MTEQLGPDAYWFVWSHQDVGSGPLTGWRQGRQGRRPQEVRDQVQLGDGNGQEELL